MRAMMSLPVPLSPWISTGTLALASLVRRSRTACMASVRPKTIASGGISPKGWTSLLTLLVVMAGFYQLGGERLQTACREPKAPRPTAVHSNLTYVVEEHQLTKEPYGRTPGNQGIAPTVTLYGGICANIFTQPKRFSGGGPSGCPRAPRDERTSGPADSTPPPALYEAPSRAESATPSATGPSLRPGRLEFPTGFERLRAKLGESRPASRPRSRSTQSQTPEILYLFHHGSSQKRVSQAVIWAISSARFPLSRRSCRPLRSFRTFVRST